MIINHQWIWYVVIPLLTITGFWFLLFGISRYIDATTRQENSNNEKNKVVMYKVSYIWWLRNFLQGKQLNYQKGRGYRTSDSLANTIYLPKVTHKLISINSLVKRILGQSQGGCQPKTTHGG